MKSLAELLDGLEDASIRDDLESSAKEIFDKEWHAHGSMDIAFQQACRNIRAGTGHIDDDLQAIRGYFMQYEAMDDLKGQLYALLQFLDCLSNMYAFDLQLKGAQDCENIAEAGGTKHVWIFRNLGLCTFWLTISP